MPDCTAEDSGSQTCVVCGQLFPAARPVCPCCRTPVGGLPPLTITQVMLLFLIGAFGGTVLYGVVFALFGLIAWLLSGAADLALFVIGFGLAAGLLMGIGDAIVQLVRYRISQPARDVPSDDPSKSWLTLPLTVAAVVVPSLRIIVLISWAIIWLFTKDYRRQAPGRRMRAAVGAVFMFIFSMVFFTAVVLIVGPPPLGGATIYEVAALVGFATLVGAVLGLLSDRL